ncbi:peroxisomal membrane protein Pex23-Penicillium chrysogenum [Penicillium taxi]|uniref:peroxisomal membrane protein Pex23-Penicillium chrysogenum n=1 Tax=Penicillium taxi TaxID=168475 RepID=UPI002544FD74|nr:peroxisomal membrane protein Pex23-Penicillium chrysogenum [Penicillium taxi]KAJ5902313.1 peroxisomal membrane protein Pex23-Penicillium chrysogenum [Penicillium taxi]
MAALEDLPWLNSMASPTNHQEHGSPDSQPPTVAPFSPSTITGSALSSRQRSSIIVHRKSPLLVATPPPITRALAHSHPFLLPLNRLMGLLTWTTEDPWQSFLLVATFWTVVLYSDAIILWAGPIIVVISLILGMYSRRFSPLSSTTSTGEKHLRKDSIEITTRHHKSLDEILETLRTLTTRCNVMLEPLLKFTDFLSTQRTATSATTRPALTVLFIRILFVTPIWIILTLPPFYLITTRRVVMTVGTIILTYHSRPARVSRVILWRSRLVRQICAIVTGLSVADPPHSSNKFQEQSKGLNIATRRRGSSGVRFTFVVYENQRRWLGIGWTYSLLPAERSAWTDEHLSSVPPKDAFELPDVRTGDAEWRWVEGTEWRIEGTGANGKPTNGEGWIYYDNKWNDGRRGQDGWDRYTRRRKWYRDAELVEVQGKEDTKGSEDTVRNYTQVPEKNDNKDEKEREEQTDAEPYSVSTLKPRRRHWFSSGKYKDKDRASSAGPTDGAADAGCSTGISFSDGTGSAKSDSRPVSTQSSSKRSRRSRREGSVAKSDTSSMRESLTNTQDHHDRWATRASGGTERAEREFGLSDEVNMALS